ncbi:MAG TPA: hypothetical protein VGE50_02275 [Gammaproteobacteria bacterium]
MTELNEIVICGLDGVLALIEHRLHHLYNEEGIKYWERFHAACIDDMPNLPLIERLNQARAEGVPVILLSGRSSGAKDATIEWLRRWQIGYDGLWLRPANDFKPAVEFKASVIAQHFANVTIRRVYESDTQIDFARWCSAQAIPCTLIGHNQGNSASRDLFELKVIRHNCAHTVLYPFYGDDDFNWPERIQQLSASNCRLCQLDEQRKEQRRNSERARYQAKERGLPPLEGSDKQSAWAETIRLNAFGAVDKVLKWMEQIGPQAEAEDPDHWHAMQQSIRKAIDYLANQSDAKWWIEHRHGMNNNLDSGRALLSAIAQALGFY